MNYQIVFIETSLNNNTYFLKDTNWYRDDNMPALGNWGNDSKTSLKFTLYEALMYYHICKFKFKNHIFKIIIHE